MSATRAFVVAIWCLCRSTATYFIASGRETSSSGQKTRVAPSGSSADDDDLSCRGSESDPSRQSARTVAAAERTRHLGVQDVETLTARPGAVLVQLEVDVVLGPLNRLVHVLDV